MPKHLFRNDSGDESEDSAEILLEMVLARNFSHAIFHLTVNLQYIPLCKKKEELMSFITIRGGKGWIVQHTASLLGGRRRVNVRHSEYLEDNLPLNETLLVTVMGNLQ